MAEEALISIRRFGGMTTNPQAEDIPNENAVWAKSIDPQDEGGVLKGMPTKGSEYSANGTHIPDVYEADWLKYDDAGTLKWDLVYIDTSDDDITVVENFYGAQADRTLTDVLTPTYAPVCVKTFNNAAQIGGGLGNQPSSVYRLLEEKKFFNFLESISAGLQAEDGKCHLIDTDADGSVKVSSATLGGATAGYFQDGYLYKYATSLLYDDGQESNLVEGASDTAGATDEYCTVQITLKGYKNDFTLMDSRVRAVKLYRAESSDGTTGGLGLYRLVRIFDINYGYENNRGLWGTANAAVTADATSLTDTRLNMTPNAHVAKTVYCGGKSLAIVSNTKTTFTGVSWSGGTPASNLEYWVYGATAWAVSSNDYVLASGGYLDYGDFPDGGGSYEAETGIPETLKYSFIRYSINEVGAGYHWVTKGRPEGETGDWDRYIYRSKRYRPNMFNWLEDRVLLPRIPTTLAFYENYLYAFAENALYRINPETLSIEDAFEGVGASNRQAVTVTKFGMFFCNLNGAYRLLGGQIDVLSDSISDDPRTQGTYGWKTFAAQTLVTKATKLRVLYEAYKRMVLFIGVQYNTSIHGAFGFYLPTSEWSLQNLGALTWTDDNWGAFNGKDGEVFISTATEYLTECFAGTTYESTVWISKEFDGGNPSQNKSWKKLKWDAIPGTGSIAGVYATEGTDIVASGTSATNDAYINIYKKTFQAMFSTIGNAKMDSAEIPMRYLEGIR